MNTSYRGLPSVGKSLSKKKTLRLSPKSIRKKSEQKQRQNEINQTQEQSNLVQTQGQNYLNQTGGQDYLSQSVMQNYSDYTQEQGYALGPDMERRPWQNYIETMPNKQYYMNTNNTKGKKFNLQLSTLNKFKNEKLFTDDENSPGKLSMKQRYDTTERNPYKSMYNKPNYNSYVQNKMVLKTHDKANTLLQIKEAILKQVAQKSSPNIKKNKISSPSKIKDLTAQGTSLYKHFRSSSLTNTDQSQDNENIKNILTERDPRSMLAERDPKRQANTIKWLSQNELEHNRIYRTIQEYVTVGDGGLHEIIHDKLNPFLAGRSKCATFVKDLFEI